MCSQDMTCFNLNIIPGHALRQWHDYLFSSINKHIIQMTSILELAMIPAFIEKKVINQDDCLSNIISISAVDAQSDCMGRAPRAVNAARNAAYDVFGYCDL